MSKTYKIKEKAIHCFRKRVGDNVNQKYNAKAEALAA